MQRMKRPCQRPRKKDLPKNELWKESINANRYEDCLFDIFKIRRSSMPHQVFFSFSVDRDKKKLGSGQCDMTRKGSDWNGDGQICNDDVTIPHL